MFDVAAYLEHLRSNGALLAEAAERAGFDAAVPPCPEWTVRDLLHHQGDIHRWATTNLTRGKSEPMSNEESLASVLTWPDDDTQLLDWFREGHARLVQTIESVPDDVVAFAFLPAPNARLFWARRQAHETAIHRGDAESATGPVTAYDPTFAADGIDEMVRGFAVRPGKLVADPARTVAVVATDADQQWLLTYGAEGLSVSDDAGTADCTVSGRASDLYQLLWNRRDTAGIDIDGDRGLVDQWRESLQVRWGGPSKK